MRINLPNQITLGRLGLAIVFVALLSAFDARRLDSQRWLLNLCFWVFLVAALSDIVDGWLARVTHSTTVFGRIIDPVVDKVMICAAFVLFASPHFWDGSRNISGVSAWMTVVILTRELLVSAVRAQAEAGGESFGALPVGKFKMAVQSVTVCVVLAQHGWNFASLDPLRSVCVWAAVIVTAGSALVYLHRARRLLLTSAALAGDAASPGGVTARDKEGAA